jgi:hypothetical protein
MLNQDNADKNVTHSGDRTQDPIKHRSARKGPGIGLSLLLLLLLLAGIGVLLEHTGIINVHPTFGRGGRPALRLGLWKLRDVPADFWARPFIQGLIRKDVVAAYPNDEFRPDQPVTRAEFAAMVQSAFSTPSTSQPELQAPNRFSDVRSDFWANSAITQVAAAGFVTGYADGTYQPQQPMLRRHALAALASGLNLTPDAPVDETLAVYDDANEIPSDVRWAIAAATEAGLVVNYPEPDQLNPNQPTTRAEAAAFIYQALVHQNEAEAVSTEGLVPQF